MIDLGFLSGERVAVLGLGKSGLAAARALHEAGAAVRAWDDKAAARTAAEAAGIPLARLPGEGLDGAAMLVLSPGIPRAHPAPHKAVAAAEAAGVPVVIDADLLARAQPEAKVLGITGTNGKSTTTALVGHILDRAGVPASVGGNLGPPCLGLEPPGPEGWYVLELSSYQLETVSALACRIGVLLNFSADHLDRYPDMEAYVAAKRRLFETAAAGSTAIIGIDDRHSRQVYTELQAVARTPGTGPDRIIPISAAGRIAGGVYVDRGRLVDAMHGVPQTVLDLAEAPALPGQHNAQNAAAAYAAARAAGLERTAIAAAMRDFPGLAHRQEPVAEIGGIRFVNDSKATNAEAALKALVCYAPIYWIAGGRPKPGGLAGIEPGLANVAEAFLIGEAEADFTDFLVAHGGVPTTRCGELGTATRAAFEAARRDGREDAVVLLSPACASFDQFANFEERGAAFAETVRGLVAQMAGDAAGGAA
ncbi:MAG: UDP-N-acetylmuramoyl-L-alanine--D-glutamate ligase [Alphaproteobacteria bacterium]|nr:UDP-N-acetylmuramoyl-L-alanine--D-glutamate ligase [Alphaproteobacteria bacterium]